MIIQWPQTLHLELHFRMTKTLSMVSHKNYSLIGIEGFVIFLTSKWIACCIDGSLWKWNPCQLLIYSMEVKIYIGFWTLKVKWTQYVICDKTPSRMQGQWFFKVGRACNNFRLDLENMSFLDGWLPLPESTSPAKFVRGGGLTSSQTILHNHISI